MGHRSVMQGATRALLLAAMAVSAGGARANPPPLPDDFLEYLGSWEADDGDWLVARASSDEGLPAARSSGQRTTTAQRPTSQSTTTDPRGTTTAPGTERK